MLDTISLFSRFLGLQLRLFIPLRFDLLHSLALHLLLVDHPRVHLEASAADDHLLSLSTALRSASVQVTLRAEQPTARPAQPSALLHLLVF